MNQLGERRRAVALGLGALLVVALAAVTLWVAGSAAWPTTREPLDIDSLASYPPFGSPTKPAIPSGTESPRPTGQGAATTGPGAATTDPATATTTPVPSVTLSGAGDIAVCGSDADEATARLLDELPGYVFTAGDNAYDDGSARDFRRCYDPTWGRHRERTFPALGNHDFRTRNAAAYFDYFGARAGDRRAGWYSLDLGAWRLIVLASDCAEVGGCGPDSPQGRWLERELAANPRECTLAIWHHPLFTTGEHGARPETRPFWRQLHDAGAEIVVNGHEHSYERFTPLDPKGDADPGSGIREFVAGTGGADLRGFTRRDRRIEARQGDVHGVLRLDLHDGSYDWAFIPVDGGDFTDEGSGTCH